MRCSAHCRPRRAAPPGSWAASDRARAAGWACRSRSGPDEFIYRPGAYEWLKFANRDPAFPDAFRALLLELRPDVVHVHHVIHFGVDALGIVRKTLPQARIILTLHEYLLICHHYGQMVTTGQEALCDRATLTDCHRCFPAISTADFFLRNRYINRFLDDVDRFIAPSRFLAARFAAWGIAADRIEVIENIVEHGTEATSPQVSTGPLRVGFFGQISRLKGMNVLFDAATALAAEGSGIQFALHGDHLGQPPEFQAEFLSRLATATDNLRYHGAYRPQQVDRLMQGVDLIVVPSIWWENSPVVIREAFRNRRPVICSDIGGMAEKVRHGLDGWHVQAGSAPALVQLLRRLETERDEVIAMATTIQAPADNRAILNAHRRCFA